MSANKKQPEQITALWISVPFSAEKPAQRGEDVGYWMLHKAAAEERFEIVGCSESWRSKGLLPQSKTWWAQRPLEQEDGYRIPIVYQYEKEGTVQVRPETFEVENDSLEDELYFEVEDAQEEGDFSSEMEGPLRWMSLAMQDAGGLDMLILGAPVDLQNLYAEKPDEIEEHLDTIVLTLGKTLESNFPFMKTEYTEMAPKAYANLENLAKQRFLIHPSLVRRFATNKSWEKVEAGLALYCYLQPEAFIFEEQGVKIATEQEERGWIQLCEGTDVLVATQVNEASFLQWMDKEAQSAELENRRI